MLSAIRKFGGGPRSSPVTVEDHADGVEPSRSPGRRGQRARYNRVETKIPGVNIAAQRGDVFGSRRGGAENGCREAVEGDIARNGLSGRCVEVGQETLKIHDPRSAVDAVGLAFGRDLPRMASGAGHADNLDAARAGCGETDRKLVGVCGRGV